MPPEDDCWRAQGLILTAGAMWNILQALNIPIHVQEVRMVQMVKLDSR